MSKLPLSTMLLDVFAGILATLMLIVAALLCLLVALNAARGQGDANSTLMITAAMFAIGGGGFYLLKRWAQRSRMPD